MGYTFTGFNMNTGAGVLQDQTIHLLSSKSKHDSRIDLNLANRTVQLSTGGASSFPISALQ